jgi:hypothetical protein
MSWWYRRPYNPALLEQICYSETNGLSGSHEWEDLLHLCKSPPFDPVSSHFNTELRILRSGTRTDSTRHSAAIYEHFTACIIYLFIYLFSFVPIYVYFSQFVYFLQFCGAFA